MSTDKSILVTGGAGFVGSHSIIEILAAGYNVVVIDNFINSSIGRNICYICVFLHCSVQSLP